MPRHRIRWTRLAFADLRDARDFVALDDPAAAAALVVRIRHGVKRLEMVPAAGRVVPERREQGYREILEPPYRIVYRVAGREVHILRVWHSRRDLATAP